MKKVFFFDRDGTLIKNIPYLNDYNKIEYFSDTFSTLKSLKLMGYEFIIITNQSGLARGLITIEQMTLIHKKMRADFSAQGIDLLDILYSPDGPNSDNNRRKPRTGMLAEAFNKFDIEKEKSYMVGDNITDIQCANNFGIKSFFLNKDKIQPTIYIDKLSDILKYI